ncbi:MAG: class I SAM-dependent methyltransferase [Actinobacteria bacterium]|nr:MAG: class I SAM-dependent methyltransferase [Actinomycetota bacterium]
MLTVDFARLGLRPHERVLDLGCGGGRHAYESLRRGADVVALDASDTELKEVAVLLAAMVEEGEAACGAGVAVNGNALALPFPDHAFDRVIAAEVLEHIPRDTAALVELARVLRPGGTMAVTVPRWGPELVNWALSDAYHSVEGGHVRIYRRSTVISRLQGVGLRVMGWHHAHALHTPYWWLRCAVGVDRADHPLVRAYHRLLVWDITAATPVTRVPERLLNPYLGKSLVVYAEKPAP